MAIEHHGIDAIHGRGLNSLHLSQVTEAFAVAEWPRRHFVCLLVWDASGVEVDTVSALVQQLLRVGASYFVCWGPGCERVHDIVDEVVAHDQAAFSVPADSCIMTTWHEDESLEQALWFFLACTVPAQPYDDSTQEALAVSIGSATWADAIRSALSDSKAFVDSVNGAG